MKDAEERKELYAKFADVAEKYLSLQRNKEAFIVIIARTPSDLMHEGDTLHHCVGRMNYDQKFAREESLISSETRTNLIHRSLHSNTRLKARKYYNATATAIASRTTAF